MTLSWTLRLLCLLFIVFGMFLAILQLALARSAPFILRRLQSAPPRRRERALLRIQFAPTSAALFMTLAVCIPAYLRFEPVHQVESVSELCLLLAAATGLWLSFSLFRGLRTLRHTLRFTRACRRSGRLVQQFESTPILAIERPSYPVALLGFIRPLIIVSADLLADGGLRPAALAIALDHERSHARHRDNWKLLSLSFLPRLNFLIADPWISAWRAAADWAADDDAVRGDSTRSLLLAEAIVRTAQVARTRAVIGSAPVIHTALTSAEYGLVTRIDRLLHPRPRRTQRSFVLTALAALTVLASATAIAAAPWVYSLSESLLHFGRF